MEIEHDIEWGACGDFVLVAEITPHPGKSDCDFRSPIGMRIGEYNGEHG